MDLIEELAIRRFEAGQSAAVTDKVVLEARIELNVNNGLCRLAMLCLPCDLEALAVGFLRGEGVLRRREDLQAVEVAPQQDRVAVCGDFDADALESLVRRWTRGTGCGGGGTARDFDAPAHASVGAGPFVSPDALGQLVGEFQAMADLWRQTGGVHACALADGERIVAFAEDVGRHNAFDKVMGKAMLTGIGVSDKLVLMTGRLSAEIVSKAVACRVPLLASRSAATGLGVRLARRCGLTLVGFVRGRRLNVYSGFERICDPCGRGFRAEESG